jgi:hypothetical protein
MKIRPKIILKTTSQKKTHWVFGHRLNKILKIEGENTYQVEWDDKSHSVVHVAQIQWYEPELLNEF